MGRKLVNANVIFNNNKDSVWVNTVHLESLLNQNVRIDQLKSIFGTYMKDQNESMFMGDFNFSDYGSENDYLSDKYMDCWLTYKKNAQLSDDTYGDTCGGSRFDRILLKSKIWNVNKFEIIGKVNMPSDHLGIIVYLSKNKIIK